MATRPEEELPESIVVGQFSGLRNNTTAERLQLGELEKALNIDIDDAGQVRRRRGQTLGAAGDFHSLTNHLQETYCVKNGSLGLLDPDYTFTALATASSDRLSYTRVGDTLYYASRAVSGKILDKVNSPWGQTGGAGQWISPVISPTETMGEVSGQMLNAPPLATEIEYYKGRIYLASRQWIWATELYQYDLVDRTKNFVQLTSNITMLQAVEEGLFVGTEDGLYFLSGTLSSGLKRNKISDAAPVPGSAVKMPASKIYPQARDSVPAEGDAVVFLTNQGICAGFDNGQMFNLTYTRLMFPSAANAAALYREQDGVNQYVAVADSGGSPKSTARIGDFVDAEIRRFQGG